MTMTTPRYDANTFGLEGYVDTLTSRCFAYPRLDLGLFVGKKFIFMQRSPSPISGLFSSDLHIWQGTHGVVSKRISIDSEDMVFTRFFSKMQKFQGKCISDTHVPNIYTFASFLQSIQIFSTCQLDFLSGGHASHCLPLWCLPNMNSPLLRDHMHAYYFALLIYCVY